MKRKEINALVTGSTRGIGAEIANKLISDGYSVITTGTNKLDDVDSDKHIQVDFLDEESRKDFLNIITSMEIDILINNAGINKIDNFSEIKLKDFDQIIDVNLRTPFLLMQAVIPNMKIKKWGRIVNISSIFGKISKEKRASYSASKFGLNGLTLASSAELSKHNILVNSVSPGFIDTSLTRNILGADGMKELADKIPIKRLGQPEEIANLVSWLVSDSNSYLTGQNLVIDGGFINV